jgi:hypothetical protein
MRFGSVRFLASNRRASKNAVLNWLVEDAAGKGRMADSDQGGIGNPI